MHYNLSYAKYDPAHCMAPGLFRSLRPGQRQLEKLNIQYKFGDLTIRFVGPEPLGADDLRVLQGLVALAAVSKNEDGLYDVITSEPISEEAKNLRNMLETRDDAKELTALVVRGSFRQLAREIGYNESGQSFKKIKDSIERLWTVSILATQNTEDRDRTVGFRLLSYLDCSESDGHIFLALNPRLTNAIIGGKGHQFLKVSLNEARALKSDPARLIHHRLSWINEGDSRRIKIDTLSEYVWSQPLNNKGEVIHVSKNTSKKRRGRVREALKELEGLGWNIKEIQPGYFEIGRPRPKAIKH